MNRFFRVFCIDLFGIGPLHNLSSLSDFDFEFSVIDETGIRRLPISVSRPLNFFLNQYWWYGEPSTPRIGESGSCRLPRCDESGSRHTDKKENQIFLIYNRIQKGSVASSYMVKYLPISSYFRSPSSYMTLQLILSEFPWGNFRFLFLLVQFPSLVSQGGQRIPASGSRGVTMWKNASIFWT